MTLDTAGRNTRDCTPWITEDGVRQATSQVPYQLGKRDYADYSPRPTYMTSGKRTLDPKPYQSTRAVRYADRDIYFGNGPLRFIPRCDLYDNHNPILDRFREAVQIADRDEGPGHAPVFAAEWLRLPLGHLAELARGNQDRELTQLAHARRVLAKLAALGRGR